MRRGIGLQRFSFRNLNVEVSQDKDGGWVFLFSGDIDEGFDHTKLPRFKGAKLHFDLSQIRNFNSCGIREWIHFLNEIESVSESLTFESCSVAVVDQVNMVPDTAKGVEITSFFAPYFCEEHGEMVLELSVKEQMKFLKKRIAPTLSCPVCQNELEFDALEESYFLFCDEETLKRAG